MVTEGPTPAHADGRSPRPRKLLHKVVRRRVRATSPGHGAVLAGATLPCERTGLPAAWTSFRACANSSAACTARVVLHEPNPPCPSQASEPAPSASRRPRERRAAPHVTRCHVTPPLSHLPSRMQRRRACRATCIYRRYVRPRPRLRLFKGIAPPTLRPRERATSPGHGVARRAESILPAARTSFRAHKPTRAQTHPRRTRRDSSCTSSETRRRHCPHSARRPRTRPALPGHAGGPNTQARAHGSSCARKCAAPSSASDVGVWRDGPGTGGTPIRGEELRRRPPIPGRVLGSSAGRTLRKPGRRGCLDAGARTHNAAGKGADLRPARWPPSDAPGPPKIVPPELPAPIPRCSPISYTVPAC